jgi:hypothetical protein
MRIWPDSTRWDVIAHFVADRGKDGTSVAVRRQHFELRILSKQLNVLDLLGKRSNLIGLPAESGA